MSRKIKINTVNTTDLENTLKENLCRKPVTISGPEKTIVVSDDTHRSEEDLKAQLERDKEVKKEIRKTIDDSKNAVKRYQETTCNENTGDAIASTKNYINSIFLYEKLSEEYINTVINPIFQKFCDNEVLVNTYTKTGLFKPLFDLFKNNNIKSIDEVLLNDELNLKIGELLLNFNKEFNFTNQNTLEDYLNLNNLKNKNIESEESIVNEDAFKGSYSINADKVGEFFLSIPKENIDTLTSVYEEVNHPDHYNVYDVEVVDMMERIFGIEETMSWCKLNAFKYRMRAGEKPTSTVEKDLKKEKWCLNKYKELKSKK